MQDFLLCPSPREHKACVSHACRSGGTAGGSSHPGVYPYLQILVLLSRRPVPQHNLQHTSTILRVRVIGERERPSCTNKLYLRKKVRQLPGCRELQREFRERGKMSLQVPQQQRCVRSYVAVGVSSQHSRQQHPHSWYFLAALPCIKPSLAASILVGWNWQQVEHRGLILRKNSIYKYVWAYQRYQSTIYCNLVSTRH